jgi:hypothetical protein
MGLDGIVGSEVRKTVYKRICLKGQCNENLGQ